MKFLLDENLSPSLVDRFKENGVDATHANYRSMTGATDVAVWRRAFDEDRVVITINARDFINLAKGAELHAGVIVLRAESLSRDEQWEWIESVTDALAEHDLVNKVVEVTGKGKYVIRDIPSR